MDLISSFPYDQTLNVALDKNDSEESYKKNA